MLGVGKVKRIIQISISDAVSKCLIISDFRVMPF